MYHVKRVNTHRESSVYKLSNPFLVLFQIELLSFVDHKAADEYNSFSREDRELATLDQIIAVATAEKDVSGSIKSGHRICSISYTNRR